MTPSQVSPTLLLTLLSAAVFCVRTAALMLGPLLVELAAAFHTSVAVTGQLAAVINVPWAITAPLIGPISDTYGRRLVGLTGLMLMAIGMLGSVLAWHYSALLFLRLLTGVGAAMIPANSVGIITDHYAPEQRGRPISILISSSFLAAVIGVPLIALLVQLGGWRLPFGVLGVLIAVLWGWQWLWLPGHRPQAAQPVALWSHFLEVGRSTGIWYVLGANALYQMAAFGLFTYVAAFLIHTYALQEGEMALPLALVGVGAMLGSLLGGYVVGGRRRLGLSSLVLLVGGVLASLTFVVDHATWITVLLSAAGIMLLTIFEPVTWALTTELAGQSRATAGGLLAVSNQIGAGIGASAAGGVLALGGFPLVGMFCVAMATGAAAVIGLRSRGSQALRPQAQGA